MEERFNSFFRSIAAFFKNNTIIWVLSVVSFALSAIIIPIVIKICKKNGWYDSTNERKVHKGNIPRLGSIGFVSSTLIVSIIYSIFISEARFSLIPFIISGFIIFAFGIIDDFLDLKAVIKLFVQIIASLIIVLAGHRFKNIGSWTIPVFLSYPLTFCWIIGIINAFNLIDGVDGLCGGLSAMIILCLAIIYCSNAVHSAAYCLFLFAAILGFLLYNKPKAKIFMGDGGSQFLGFMIATLPLFETTENFEYNKFLLMIDLVSIPMLDTFAAIWRRLRDHKRIMSPDKAHLHHKLMNMGFSTKGILALLLSIQALLCIVVLWAMALRGRKAFVILIVTYALMIVFFTVIHYRNRSVLRKQLQETQKD